MSDIKTVTTASVYFKPAGELVYKRLFPLTKHDDAETPSITLNGTFQGYPIATVLPNPTKKFSLQVVANTQLQPTIINYLLTCKHYGTLSLGDPDAAGAILGEDYITYRVAAPTWNFSRKGLNYGKLQYTFDISFETVDDHSW